MLKIEKMFPGKKQIATRGEDETMHHRLGTGVDSMIILDFVPSPTLSFAQVCVIFSPRLRMINLSSPIGNHINKVITHTDLKK